MFPITMTFTVLNPEQLAALYAVASGNSPAPVAKAEKPVKQEKAETAKKPEVESKPVAATEPAHTPTTAETPAAPAEKAPTSESTSPVEAPMTSDERGVMVKAKVAKTSRETVVALLAEFGVKNASSITDPVKLAEFDAKLKAL